MLGQETETIIVNGTTDKIEVDGPNVLLSGTVSDPCGHYLDGVYVDCSWCAAVSYGGRWSTGCLDMYGWYSCNFELDGFRDAYESQYYSGGNGTIEFGNTTMYYVDDDWDDDGVINCNDNCPEVPNGPEKGTRLWGARKGLSCYQFRGDCGCGGDWGCDVMQYDKNFNAWSLRPGIACSECMDEGQPLNACKPN